ncbi:MAG: hypothetical protein ACM3PU_06045 [Gemmatimonadota bacterium]
MNAPLSASPAVDAQLAIDDQHPWLGLASFTEETRGYFHGREEEVTELARRVQRKLLTVLFGQSGLGKTSILRAGIVPRLRPEGYCPVYVRIDYAPESPPPAAQIKQAIFRATETSGQWTKPGVAVEGESLWEFLHHRDDVLLDANGKPVIPLLIFDQFEEIFTLAQADDTGRQRATQFIEDLADLVENRLPKALEARLEGDESITERFDFGRADYRILIALREDYLAHLESVKGVMPSITQNRMRLARMTGQQALAAVIKPGGRLVSQEVAEAIVRFIAGGSELRNAEVEPSLLSLICRELNNARIAQGRAEISADLLAGSHDTILAEFYERALADQPAAVRKVIEDQLLTESGFRESLAEERVLKAFAAAGAAPDALATLVNRRLLRIEERLDVRRVELTHDVLCGVVKASRQLRLEREALEEAERQLAAQREREAATRKALIRARQIAAGCAVLAIVAVAASVFGYISTKRAQQAEARALQSHRLAETARGESERLIVYLLDDFYRELEPVGRLDIVVELARRAVDYYQGLPRELRTRETDRNRSLALVRYGAALRTQGKLTEASPVLDDAIQTLDTLRKDGDNSEVTAIGLSLGLAAKGRVIDSAGRSVDALPPAERAVDVIKAVAEAPGSSVAARRAYGLALTQLGFFQMRQNRDDLATPTLQKSLAMFRSIDDLQLKDLDAAANFSITSSWLSESLTIQGRNDEAKAVGTEGISVASKVLDRNPTHMLALRGRALLAINLARLAGTAFRPAEAQALADDSARDWTMLLRVDPSNVIAWNNLGVAREGAHQSLLAQGRVRAAMAKLEEARVLEPMTAKSSMVAGAYSFNRNLLGNLAAELGEIQRANAYNANAERYFNLSLKGIPAGTFDHAYWSAFLEVWKAEAALSLGDFARTRSLADSARVQVEKLKPEAEFSRQQQAELLRRLSFALGTAAEWTNDLAGAEKNFRAAVEYRKRTPVRNQFEQREAAVEVALHAAALARLGRLSEARQTIEPVVELYRGYAARNKDNQTVKSEMAGVLYAAALANPGQGKALLDEARTLFKSLPSELREMRSVAHLGDRIAEAQRREALP